MTVTKAMLDQLREERATPQLQLDYTIGGTIEKQVATQHAARREQTIAAGEQTLNAALQDFRAQQSLSSHEGLAMAHFNHQH